MKTYAPLFNRPYSAFKSVLTGCATIFFWLFFFQQNGAAQPVNDEICSATTLTVGTSCNLVLYTTASATSTPGLATPPCAGNGKDVWFKFVVPASGMFTIETASGTVLDGVVSVYTGTCAVPTYAYCDDDSGPGLMPLLVSSGFVPGTTVYIRFYKKGGGGGGTFSICVWDNNPPLGSNADCATAQQLCTESDVTSNSTSGGDIHDLTGTNKGCLTPNEHQSSWYYFTFDKPGELDFTITPINPADNYNFAIWGPDPICPLTSDPLRCSASNSTGATGIRTGETETTEGTSGDNWVKFITVNAGETYLLYIDNYSASGSGFTLAFDGPPTITCKDYLLPVTLAAFSGAAAGSYNDLVWTTASEFNNQYFEIEHSDDRMDFRKIGTLTGAGTSTQTHQYTYNDHEPFPGATYYRLKMVDANNVATYSDVILVENNTAVNFTIAPNPAAGTFTISHMEQTGDQYFIQIYNASGQITYQKNAFANGEFITDHIALKVKGIYTVVLSDGSQVASRRIVIN